MRGDKQNIIVDLTFEFAKLIIKYCQELEHRRQFLLMNQLFKSGTSIGANVREAQNAESKNDFIHKMKIGAKEADETEYWLMLCKASPNFPNCDDLIDKVQTIIRVLSKIIATSKSSPNLQISKSSN